MTMCASGSLGIISCPQGGCSSIAMAVDGNITGSKSLSTLSTTAGKSAPHSMSEFYSYAPTPKYVDFTCITCTGNNTATATACSSVDVSPAMVSGECYCANFYFYLVSDATYGSITCFNISRNGGSVITCTIPQGNTCFGNYCMCIIYGDTVCIRTRASVTGTNLGVAGESCVCLQSMVAGGSPNISKGTTRTQQYSYTCGSIV